MTYRLALLLALLPACGGSDPSEGRDAGLFPDAATPGNGGADASPDPDNNGLHDAASVDRTASPDRTPAASPPDGGGAVAPDLDGRLVFFRSEVIHRIEITVDPSRWLAFMNEHRRFNSNATKTWYQANFRIDGVDLQNVAFHSFGWGSRDENRNKPNLSLDINRIVPGQSLRGIERMRIKNNGQDVSGLRQEILYQAMRESKLMAPRSTYADLFVNGQPYGFYFVEESFTSGFVRERTGNSNGAAYEPVGCQGLLAPADDGCDGIAGFFSSNFNPMVGAAPHLVGLCRALNGPAEGMIEAVAPYIVLSEWIDQIAIDTALAGNNDGFSVAGSNFRLYHDTTLNKLRLVVLGPDDTFVLDQLPGPSFLRPEPTESCLDDNPEYRDIFLEKLTGTPRGLALYQEAVRRLRTGVLADQKVKQHVDALWAIIGDRARTDPLKVTYYDADESKESIKTYVDRRWKALADAGF